MSVNRPGHYANYFTFTLERDAAIEVRFDSVIPPYMYLLTGQGIDGEVVASGEDIGCSLESQLRRERGETPTYPVNYTIEATTFEPGLSGDFSIILYMDGTSGSCES